MLIFPTRCIHTSLFISLTAVIEVITHKKKQAHTMLRVWPETVVTPITAAQLPE